MDAVRDTIEVDLVEESLVGHFIKGLGKIQEDKVGLVSHVSQVDIFGKVLFGEEYLKLC
jgi:hypothetical protein